MQGRSDSGLPDLNVVPDIKSPPKEQGAVSETVEPADIHVLQRAAQKLQPCLRMQDTRKALPNRKETE
jgi:hypothetical protein